MTNEQKKILLDLIDEKISELFRSYQVALTPYHATLAYELRKEYMHLYNEVAHWVKYDV